jgi:hypothetical protein
MMFGPMRAMARDPEGKVLLGSAIALLTAGTVVYTILESWSPLDALYFCVVTLAPLLALAWLARGERKVVWETGR